MSNERGFSIADRLWVICKDISKLADDMYNNRIGLSDASIMLDRYLQRLLIIHLDEHNKKEDKKNGNA